MFAGLFRFRNNTLGLLQSSSVSLVLSRLVVQAVAIALRRIETVDRTLAIEVILTDIGVDQSQSGVSSVQVQ